MEQVNPEAMFLEQPKNRIDIQVRFIAYIIAQIKDSEDSRQCYHQARYQRNVWNTIRYHGEMGKYHEHKKQQCA